MKTHSVKPLVLALVASFAVAQVALAETAPRLREDVSVTPGRAVTPADENVISSSASMVMHHVVRARDALRKNNAELAKTELRQADTLLDIIQDNVPTTVVKNRVWTADNKLKYENTEEIPASVVPIYASLEERADFDRVKLPGKSAAKEANPAEKDTKDAKAAAKTPTPSVREEAEARDASLYYEEVDMPVNAVRHFVTAAQSELDKGNNSEAEKNLRAALDSVDYSELYLPAPLLAARINLDRAQAHFDAGRVSQAHADVSRAITQLERADTQADPDSKADVDKLLVDAKSLETRIDKSEPGLAAELKGLWRRAEAQADRAMEATTIGWAKLRQTDTLRNALIEAKRHVAYADIDANVAGDAKQAMGELEKARSWLEKAAQADAGKSDEAVYVKDIRAVVDTLLSGQATPGKGEMANLKQQLTQAIERS